MKFSDEDSPAAASLIYLFQFNQQTLVDSLRAPAGIAESLYHDSNPLVTPSITGVSPFSFRGEFIQSSTHAYRSLETQIPTVPKNSRDPYVQFFLRFHQENINEFHYFCYHDDQKFCTTTLMAMVQQSDALCNAVAAFSALIYSIRIDHFTRVQAFTYYALALQQLRVLLDQTVMNVDECHMAIATSLQLACFDVSNIWIIMLTHSVSSMIP